MPSRRSLARALEAVEDFDVPRAELEQYLTPPEVAAHVCHVAHLQGDLADRTVVDLGTGTGMLAIAAAFADPARVLGIDVDPDALALARRNARRLLGDDRIDWVRGDAGRAPLCTDDATVLSNPPFGAQRGNRHADRRFLETASRVGAVSYTIHNEGSRSFVESYAGDRGGSVTHAFRATMALERRFSFHETESETLEAEVFRIEWPRE